MAIHFRSQIVNQEIKGTVIDASELGWCCDGSSTTQKTRANCQGYPFILGALNGNQCAATNANCPSSFTGLIPGACCYWKNVNGDYTQQCTLVINNEQCDALHQGFSEGLQYSFYPGQFCQNDGGSVVCNGVKRVYGDDLTCNPDDSTNCFDPNNILGNCCHNETAGTICSITTKPECGNGVWSPPKNGVIMSCVDKAPCDGVYFSKSYKVPTTDIDEIKGATSVIEKLPQIGDYYQGGVFVGIFNPGTPINSDGGSEIFGNASTGNASIYRARGDGVGNKRAGWVLIADLEDHIADAGYTGINLFDNISFAETPSTALDTFASSAYDGLYNTVNNTSSLYSSIKQYTSNGFNDWYLPSQDELALYCNNIKPDTQLYNNYKILEGTYLTSTLFSLGNQRQFNSTYFNYTQQITSFNYGQVNLLPVTEKAKIKLFRRIYLGPEIIISNTRDIIDCDVCLKKAADERNDAMKVVAKQYEDLQKWIKGIKPNCVVGPNDDEDKCDISCKKADGGGVIPGYPKTPYCCLQDIFNHIGDELWKATGIPGLIEQIQAIGNTEWGNGDTYKNWLKGVTEFGILVTTLVETITGQAIGKVGEFVYGFPLRSYNTTAFGFRDVNGELYGGHTPSIQTIGKDGQVFQRAQDSFDIYAFNKMCLGGEFGSEMERLGLIRTLKDIENNRVEVIITTEGLKELSNLALTDQPITRAGNIKIKNTGSFGTSYQQQYKEALDYVSNSSMMRQYYPERPGEISAKKVLQYVSAESGPAVRFNPNRPINPTTGFRMEPAERSIADIVSAAWAWGKGENSTVGGILRGARLTSGALFSSLRSGAVWLKLLSGIAGIVGPIFLEAIANLLIEFAFCKDEADAYIRQETTRLFGQQDCRDKNGVCKDPDKLPPVPPPPMPDVNSYCRCQGCPEPEKWRKCVGESGIIQLKWIEAVKRCCANPECKPPKVKSPPKICLNIQNLDDPRKKNITPIETNPDGTPKYPQQPYDYPLPERTVPGRYLPVPVIIPGGGFYPPPVIR